MAQAQPCIRCEAGESSWALTARDETTGMDPGTTLFLCGGCWVEFIMQWAEAVAQGAASDPVEPPVEPAEAGWEYETTEGPKSARKAGKAKAEVAEPEISEEAETSDVVG